MPKGRYDVSGLVEAKFEAGSRGRVLRNLLGIIRKRDMDRAEAETQLRAFDTCSANYGPDHRFRAADILEMHREWLGGIYQWAGRLRRVQVSKSGFLFAAPAQIPKLMASLEAGPFRKYTPCRLARMLAVVMGLQAGLPPLDFSGVQGRERQIYFDAVRRGLDRDYLPMRQVFGKVIAKTLRAYGGRSFSSQ